MQTSETEITIPDDIHSCERCDELFVTINDLEVHKTNQCKFKSGLFNCRYCRKKFNRADYRKYHERNCDKNNADKGKKSAKRQKMNDADISQNANLQAESSSVQIGGGETYNQHSEYWEMPIEVNAALNKTAVTYL